MGKYYVTFDVGGTTVKVGIFNGKKELIEKRAFDTVITKTNAEKNLIKSTFNFLDEYLKNNTHGIKKSNLVGIGYDTPGPVVKNKVLKAVNINWKKHYDIIAAVKEKYGKKINSVVLNDANAATLGEFSETLKKKYNNICLMTLGTAIGTGIIVNDELIEGRTGIAGEICHLRVDKTKYAIKCKCGNIGCLETVASGRGIYNIYKRLGGKKLKSAKEIIRAAKKGNALCKKALDVSLGYISDIIVMLMHVYEPEVVLVGGGVSKEGTIITKTIEKHLKGKVFMTKKLPKIMIAKLKNDAGIYGVVSKL